MATLENRAGRFRIVFRFAGTKYTRALKTDNPTHAEASLARVKDNLHRLNLGTLVPPDDVDLATFLLSDGRRDRKPKPPSTRTLKALFSAFFESIPAGSLEDSTITGMRIHCGHFTRVFRENFAFRELNLADLQRYVDARSKEIGLHGKSISGATIKKDLITFKTIWTWAVRAGELQRPFPWKGLKFPKTTEKPHFQTYDEIERKIARGNLSQAEQAELWECLFLTVPEIKSLLDHVKKHARYAFIYPMLVFAAHTGSRRSEMTRSLIDDIDFASKTIVIREKKRVRGKRTTRRVPMSSLLHDVLTQWLAEHPGGQYTFCLPLDVPRSKTDRTEHLPLTCHVAHDHFKRTLAESKWDKLRGWHVFRHSFCSNCAARGVDQRIINAWVGHQTEEMVRRYRHLIPDQQRDAIDSVFAKRE